MNLCIEKVKLNYELNGATPTFTITYRCSFSLKTDPYDVSKPASTDATKYFQPGAFDTAYPIAYSIEQDFIITVKNINEPPSINYTLTGLGNGNMQENAAPNFEIATFSCQDDPEASLCGGCSNMMYGCSGNAMHTTWGQTNCGDVVRAFKVVGQRLLVNDPSILNYEALLDSLGTTTVAVTVRIIDDGHGQCEGVKGDFLMSDFTTFEVTILDVNERPTSLSLVCTADDAQANPPLCISAAFEIDVTTASIGDVIGKLVAEDEDAGDTHDFFMVRGTDYFEIINDTDTNGAAVQKVQINNINYDGTSSRVLIMSFYVTDSGGLRYPQNGEIIHEIVLKYQHVLPVNHFPFLLI